MPVSVKTRQRSSTSYQEKVSDHTGIVADDTVSLYLNEMSRVPLLSRKEEVQLAKRMERGHEARQRLLELNGIDDNLSETRRIIEDGEAARDHLIKANVRLVVNIAKKYRKYGSSFLDLIQAGNVGLIRAVDKFDYTKGNRFSTYATWWIRRSVLRFLNQNERTIRLPNYLSTRIRKIHKVNKQLTKKLSRDPTIEEIAKEVEHTAEEVEKLLGYSRRSVSLDQPVGEEGDSDLKSLIQNKNAPNPFGSVQEHLLEEDVLKSLDILTEREAEILKLRFGLGGRKSHTLKELGAMFGVTRERIRQIQQGALRKLRHPQVRRKLRHYL
jgi:RNA polymerase primary sigma factor